MTASSTTRDDLQAAAEEPVPDHFGPYGGRFVAETLIPALDELNQAWHACLADAAFHAELDEILRDYVGRPTPLTRVPRFEEAIGAKGPVYFKREDLAHTGAHKINNAIGQGLIAKRLGKKRVIAETGAGQHGVATATACALLGLDCEVYMGALDMERQQPNVQRMRMLGTKVIPVSSGTGTLKDALSEALRDWVGSVQNTHYCIGSTAGPHPYPALVRTLQAVIGREARAQIISREGRLPGVVAACVGGGSNAMGIFHAFVPDAGVRLVGLEAAGGGVETGHHSATLTAGRPGVLHGSYSYVLQDAWGQILEAHSVSAGLDYPGVGPEHAWLKDSGRAEYLAITDAEALDAALLVSRTTGILPALETAHAIAWVQQVAKELPEGSPVLLNMSGRGDKDLGTYEKNVDFEALEAGAQNHG